MAAMLVGIEGGTWVAGLVVDGYVVGEKLLVLVGPNGSVAHPCDAALYAWRGAPVAHDAGPWYWSAGRAERSCSCRLHEKLQASVWEGLD